MVCCALVFMMVPGAAFFYGGMLRKQSMSSIMAQSLVCCGILGLVWFVCGYTLAFGSDGFLIGDWSRLFMEGAVEDASGADISEMEFAMFQMMFAILTAMLMVGAFAERVRFPVICWFLVAWSLLVYVPMAHWVWGGGMFDQLFTVLDFAGGTVVHICAGVSGIAVALYVGVRRDSVRKSRAHNITLAYIGAMMLWIGWMGFNGGSGLYADGQAIRAIMVTNVSAVTAMMVWAVIQYYRTGRVTVLGLITGAIAGMVAITPAAGYVHLWAGLVFGLLAAVVCYTSVSYFHNSRKLDDALDVFAVHGCGGILGAMLTGVFASSEYGPFDGLAYGSLDLFLGEAASVLITLVYCFAVSYAIIAVIGRFVKVRVPSEEETVGPDIAEHGEPAYFN
ncbi:MAG: ammonium transporter [Candidatus Methanomethylophilaceae archaeon]|nr:ammonium transporter [Candidatus Methanomethylophilaceae archaeon]